MDQNVNSGMPRERLDCPKNRKTKNTAKICSKQCPEVRLDRLPVEIEIKVALLVDAARDPSDLE